MASLTMPTTPKASAARVGFSFGDAVKSGVTRPAETSPVARAPPQVASVVLDESDDHDCDGRQTPVPSNSSSGRTNNSDKSNLSSSPPSSAPPLTPTVTESSGIVPTIISDTRSTASLAPDTARPFSGISTPSLAVPMAIHGFGTLGGEEQLKQALGSKDRIFVVMLANEIEAFIARVQCGERPVEAHSLPHAVFTQTHLGILDTSVRVQSQATSKFQRMLVYKAADWYGIKSAGGPEGSMYIGTQGPLDEKSTKLKLPALVPERENKLAGRQFQIMQRRPATTAPSGSGSASGSGPGGNGTGEGGPSSRKTLEQREAEYAQARERIFQSQSNGEGETSTAAETAAAIKEKEDRNRARRAEEDDLGPTASRFPRNSEMVYASLYHPPSEGPQSPYDPNAHAYAQAHGFYDPNAQYGMGYMPMPVPMNGGQYADPYAMGTMGQINTMGMGNMQVPLQMAPNGHAPFPPNTHAYDVNGQPIMLVSNGMGAYVPWGPQMGMPQSGPGQAGVPPPQAGMHAHQHPQWAYGNAPMPGGMPMQGPSYSTHNISGPHSNGNGHGNSVSAGSSASAFSSPTSVSSFGGYSHSNGRGPASRNGSSTFSPSAGPSGGLAPGNPRLGSGPGTNLQHPKPQRPQPQHNNSYASSSISSRSYQDYSRPHSRGSTTSTRSAASSVRLGAMYPVNVGPGYLGNQQYGGGYVNGTQHQQQPVQGGGRQRAVTRDVNGLTSLNITRERRPRGRSPSSTTTTSSRSSRRTNANGGVQTYHPLPQRPDWTTITGAAPPASQTTVTSPSIGSTIPPSSPAQSDLASVSVSMTDGTGGVSPPAELVVSAEGEREDRGAGEVQGDSTQEAEAQGHLEPNGSEELDASFDAAVPANGERVPAAASSAPEKSIKADDSDFPTRSVSASRPQMLFNPKPKAVLASASRPTSAAPAPAQPNIGLGLPGSASLNGSTGEVGDIGMTPEDVIEAKLRAISVTTGVAIGPPPSRNVSATYAKAVRRE